MIRERGIDGTSVDDAMGAAGLTRGGFYAHFDDKTAMLVEALDLIFDTAKQRWVSGGARARADMSSSEWKQKALKVYLSEAHLDDPGDGCGAPALAAEIGRGPTALKTTTEHHLAELFELIATRLGSAEAHRQEAIALLSSCVGAMALARAVEDRGLAREILEATKASLLAAK